MDHHQPAATPEVSKRRHFITAAGVAASVTLIGAGRPAAAATAAKADTCVGLVPYFEVNEGKLAEFKALGPKFVALTRNEPGCLYYAFTFSGNTAHCREGYVSGEAVLAHLGNVDAVLKQALGMSKLARLEVHGPAAELEKLKGPLGGLNPQYFELVEGGFRV
jgi:quinol monooxygenase YgiN